MSKTLSYATKKPIHMVEEHSDSDSEEMFIDMVKSNYGEDWNVDLIINDRKTRFKIDTGAQCNIIPESIHRQTGAQLGKSKAKLVTYGGQCLKPIGKCLLLTEYKKRFHHVEFQVINQSATPLLGLTTCVCLGFIKRISEVKTWPSQDIQEKYADVFDGLGCFEGEQHIKIRADAQPIIHAPRKVPVALRDKK